MSITRINRQGEREIYKTYTAAWLAARATRKARRAKDPQVQQRRTRHLAAGRKEA